jgi:hypothetical protein
MKTQAMLGMLLLALAPQGPKAKAEVVGIHVTKTPYKEDKDLWVGSGSGSGVRLDVIVTSDEGGIIKLDDKKSKITKFADDKGTDLLKKPAGSDDGFSGFGPIGPFAKVSKDAKACLLNVDGKSVPASGARTLQLEGTFVLIVGKGKEVAKENVELRKGATFKLGGVAFKIDAVGKPDFGDAAMQLTLSTKEGSKVAQVRFLDAGGKEIDAKPAGSSAMSFGDDTSYSWNYDFKQEVKAAAIEVTLWKGVANLDVPVKVSVSVGF